MRILQISNRVPWPLDEGGNIGIYNFTRSFSAQGHEVWLYCLDGFKHHTPLPQAKMALEPLAKLRIHPIDTDVRWEAAFRNLFSRRSYNVERFDNGAFRSEIVELLKNEHFDVVQLEGTYTGPYVDAIRSQHQGLLSLRMHNAEFEIWERLANHSRNPLKKAYLRLLSKRLKRYEQELLCKVDTVIPVTPNDLERFEALAGPLNGLVIPAGIDTDHWKFCPTGKTEDWYHLGSLEWTPNVEAVDWYLQEIHPAVADTDPDYRFHLAGKGMPEDRYAPNSRFLVHGAVPDAFRFTESMDVCVVPLRSGSGIRLKILEAMAAGKLVISTTTGAQGIDYSAGTHLLIADSAAEFASIADRLRKGDIPVRQILQNARKLVEDRYSISAVSRQLLDHYRDLLASRKAGEVG